MFGLYTWHTLNCGVRICVETLGCDKDYGCTVSRDIFMTQYEVDGN